MTSAGPQKCCKIKDFDIFGRRSLQRRSKKDKSDFRIENFFYIKSKQEVNGNANY